MPGLMNFNTSIMLGVLFRWILFTQPATFFIASMRRVIINLIGLALTWIIWLWLAGQELTLATALAIAVCGVLAIIPAVFIGRRMLEHQPTIERADLLTTLVHYLIGILFGSAVIAATKFGLGSPAWPISLPSWLGLVLMLIAGLAVLIVIINLAIKGLGAPFAVVFTRMVATEWMYAWTRNPMILSALAFLVGLGLWLQSALFIVWVLVVVSPAFLVFVKVYEERELEIRFGEDYLEYKARTPMFFPRKPRN